MAIRALDHIYVETRRWRAAVAFWEGLGFGFAEQWGEAGHRAGRLVAGDATVVLAEVDSATEPEMNVFFALEKADEYAPSAAVPIVEPLSATHWGSRWIRVSDPEGRVYCLEETAED